MKLFLRFLVVLAILAAAAAGFGLVLWLFAPALPGQPLEGNLDPTHQEVPVREVLPPDDGPAAGIADLTPDRRLDAVLEETESAEAYREARDEMRAALEAREDEIDPELWKPVQENLNVVETAVLDILMALSEDPENESLRRLLVQAYTNELGLLRKALNLAGDPPDEATQDGG